MAKNVLSRLIVRIEGQKDGSLNQALRSTKDSVRDLSGELSSLATTGAVALGAMTAALSMQVKTWVDAAAEMEIYHAKLTTLTGSTEIANQKLQEAVAFAAKTPFQVGQIVNATVQIETYGKSAKKWLPLAADLAAGMGVSVDQAAGVVGRALSGSYMAFRSLRDQFGINNQMLKEHGANMLKTGGISLKTTKDIEAAAKALESITRTKFSGAVERQAKTFKGQFSLLQDAITRLNVAMGKELLPTMGKLVAKSKEFVEQLEKMAPETKKTIATTTLWAIGLGGLGSALLGVVAVIPHVVAGLALIAKSAAISGPIGIITVSIGLLAKSMIEINDANLKLNQAYLDQQKILKESNVSYVAFRKLRRGEKLDQNEIIEARRYLVELIKHESFAMRKGYKERIAFYQTELGKLEQLTQNWLRYAEATGQVKPNTALHKAEADAMREHIDVRERLLALGDLDQKGTRELINLYRNLAKKLEGFKGTEKEREEFLDKARKLEKAHHADIKKASQEKRDDALDNARFLIDLAKAQGKLTAEAEIKALKTIMQTIKLDKNQKRQIILEIAGLRKQAAEDEIKNSKKVAKQKEKANKKDLDDAKKALRKKYDLNKDAFEDIIDLEKDQLDSEIGNLADKFAEGDDVGGKLVDKIKEKTDLELNNIKLLESEMRAKGVSELLITEKIRLLKMKAFQEERQELEGILQQNKNINEERFPTRQKMRTLDEFLKRQTELFDRPGGREPVDTQKLQDAQRRAVSNYNQLRAGKTITPEQRQLMQKQFQTGQVQINGNIILDFGGGKQSVVSQGIKAKVTKDGFSFGIQPEVLKQLTGEVKPFGR